MTKKDIRYFLFQNRSYTPIPIALAILYFSDLRSSFILAGILLMIAGEIIRLNGVRYAGGSTRTRHVGAKVLCTSGPFAYMRNPLYVGNIIIYIGVVLFAGGKHIWVLLIITVAFFVFQYIFIISLEEDTLVKIFGNDYLHYKNRVPRFLPRLKPWSGGLKTYPMDLFYTIKTEKRTLQTLAIFILLIILRSKYLY